MFKAKYQLIILGDSDNVYKNLIISTFLERINQVGVSKEMIEILTLSSIENYISKNPTTCLFFGNGINISNQEIEVLNILIKDAVFIVPLVKELDQYQSLTPPILEKINGTQLSSNNDIEIIVSILLEGFELLRKSRRIFVSYKRSESSKIALQLYQYLDSKGFNVFLDTHDLRPGAIFQDELWHQMVDTDIVVLLNTPNFFDSHWTSEEFSQANAMNINILQIIWPRTSRKRHSELCIPEYLNTSDFYLRSSNKLKSKTLIKLGSKIESLRARSLASRQDNIIQEFIRASHEQNINATLQSNKMIEVTETKNGDKFLIIPAIGVPQSLSYNQVDDIIQKTQKEKYKPILLYDHRNILKSWIIHLDYLDKHLPTKGAKISEIEKWLKTNCL